MWNYHPHNLNRAMKFEEKEKGGLQSHQEDHRLMLQHFEHMQSTFDELGWFRGSLRTYSVHRAN